MADHGTVFVFLTILMLVTAILVAGMKYFSKAWSARSLTSAEETYRRLAENATSAQNALAASLAEVQANVFELKTSLASIEKILREVG